MFTPDDNHDDPETSTLFTVSGLRAPFPYFGGKASVAALVWGRFGDVPNYVEPFFGSGAVLLARPHRPRVETANDSDALLCNFWRSLRADPDEVAYWADYPVSEVDLHSVHLWLLSCKPDMARLIADPDWYDAKAAGRWCWGLCCWIGSGWCSGRGPWRLVDGVLQKGGDPGELDPPRAPPPAEGIERKRPHLATGGKGTHADRSTDLYAYLGALSERLRRVRITCGDWTRVLGPSVTTKHGLTAVLLDPPYAHEGRDDDLYTHDADIASEVRAWAVEHGDDPLLRIAYCGYDDGQPWPEGWEVARWKAKGGYGSQGEGRGRENAAREYIAFSPHCLKPGKRATLFDVDEYAA
jgi:DNA adenine methylase